MFGFIKNIFQGSKADDKHIQLVDKTAAILHEHWNNNGKMDDGIVSLIVQGEPWPTVVQSFAFVRRTNSIIIASNGLSWPQSSKAKTSGFGFEVFLETNSIAPEYLSHDGNKNGLQYSFAYSVVGSTADVAAQNPNLADMVEQYGAVSIEYPDFQSAEVANQVPSRFVLDNGNLGILIGAPQPDFSTTLAMPCGPIRLLAITLLTAKELAYIQEHGVNGRLAILENLTALPYEQRISLDRPDVTPQ